MSRLIVASLFAALLNACAMQPVNNVKLPDVAGAPACPGKECWPSEFLTDVISASQDYRQDWHRDSARGQFQQDEDNP